MEGCSEFILTLEEKVYKANKTTLELLKQLKEDENEIAYLKEHAEELRKKVAVYVPCKSDLIDRKLAEFINNWPDKQKLKNLFTRESEGIYQFGTKRLAIRVENDKINVRVGGGYLSIEEFLETYTTVELQKIGRKDNALKKSISKNKESHGRVRSGERRRSAINPSKFDLTKHTQSEAKLESYQSLQDLHVLTRNTSQFNILGEARKSQNE